MWLCAGKMAYSNTDNCGEIATGVMDTLGSMHGNCWMHLIVCNLFKRRATLHGLFTKEENRATFKKMLDVLHAVAGVVPSHQTEEVFFAMYAAFELYWQQEEQDLQSSPPLKHA